MHVDRIGGAGELAGKCLCTRDDEQRVREMPTPGVARPVMHGCRVGVDGNGEGVRLAGGGGNDESAVSGAEIDDGAIVVAVREERIGLADVDVDDHAPLEQLHRRRGYGGETP